MTYFVSIDMFARICKNISAWCNYDLDANVDGNTDMKNSLEYNYIAKYCSNIREPTSKNQNRKVYPFGYIVFLVKTGKINLKLIKYLNIIAFPNIYGYNYVFAQGVMPNTFVLYAIKDIPGNENITDANAIKSEHSKLVGIITYEDFAKLPFVYI
jgi:hypothetical protein